MIVETKYSLDDEVWYILSNKVEKSVIESISWQQGYKSHSPNLFYRLRNRNEDFREDKLFASKDELLKTL